MFFFQQNDVNSSYESVNLPGTIMDDMNPLAASDVLAQKYDNLEDFKISKASDMQKVCFLF